LLRIEDVTHGFEGLLHQSELDGRTVEIGDLLTVEIARFDVVRRRIGFVLALAGIPPDPKPSDNAEESALHTNLRNESELRSSIEIRDFLVDQLNLMLRRPGMYGGEMAILLATDHLAYIERGEDAWAAGLEAMRDRGAFVCTG
jgi:hypothetical protein